MHNKDIIEQVSGNRIQDAGNKPKVVPLFRRSYPARYYVSGCYDNNGFFTDWASRTVLHTGDANTAASKSGDGYRKGVVNQIKEANFPGKTIPRT